MTSILFKRPNNPLWNLGFRPFFLGAAVVTVISMALWMAVYVFHLGLPLRGITSFQWHAHEMIYGFAMAVIAGFLLTAVKNWTGVQTLYGLGLAILFTLWTIPRILFLFGTSWLFISGFFDLLFAVCLLGAIIYPIAKAKQWRQVGIIAILLLLGLGNACFYLGAAGFSERGTYIGIYGGLFLIIGLVLVVGRRVIPFFVEVGVGYPVKLRNSPALDITIIALYIAFFISEVILQNKWIAAGTALILALTNSMRLVGWYTKGIWQKPLLWSLFVAFAWINIGFLLLAINVFLNLSNVTVIHAFSVGGIGLIILSMIARVTLGHTGRNIQNPPPIVRISLIIIIIGTVLRVIAPLLIGNYYVFWMASAQMLWIVAFSIFLITYLPMLTGPRVDGQFG